MSSGGSGFTGFQRGNSKPTRRRRFLEIGTRGRPVEQSDRVNAGRVRAGWAGWAGGRVGWTALAKGFGQDNLSKSRKLCYYYYY